MRLRSVLLVAFLLLSPTLAKAQTAISGIINSYAEVTAVQDNVLDVVNSAGFAPGDKVLIMQMKGAAVNLTNTAVFGTITTQGNAGCYEYSRIDTVINNQIFLTRTPCQCTFEAADIVQVIRVPEYQDAEVTAVLSCLPWNGAVGGVLALDVKGTLTLNADIEVSGLGFRGGSHCGGGFGCNNQNYTLNFVNANSCAGGEKGESIAIIPAASLGARGRGANGGGGGNPGNSGGGGGANFGQGGLGGNEYSGCGATGVQGIGGQAIATMPNFVFAGGGGGGGYEDNNQNIGDGESGGGIVMIQADSIQGGGRAIRASGNDVIPITNDESGGGGGAGGSIYLYTRVYGGTLDVHVDGGEGGSTFNMIFTNQCHGPGGGGGGGLVWFNQAVQPAQVNVSALGGDPGLVLHPQSPCLNTPFGGTAGDDGGIKFNLDSLRISEVVPDIGVDTAICQGESVELDAGDSWVSYDWSTGEQTQTVVVDSSGIFTVSVTDAQGCTLKDSLELLVSQPMAVSFDIDDQTCRTPEEGAITTDLTGGIPDFNYLWSTGDTTPSLSNLVAGTYFLTIVDSVGCSLQTQAVVPPPPNIVIDAGPDKVIALGTGTALLPTWSPPGLTYSFSWTPADYLDNDLVLNPYSEPLQSLTYTVTIVDSESACTASDDIRITVTTLPDNHVPTAFSPNGDNRNELFYPMVDPEYELVLFQVFSRWGELIHNDLSPWDGTYNGEPALPDVYVFRAEFVGLIEPDETDQRIGNVTLIR